MMTEAGEATSSGDSQLQRMLKNAAQANEHASAAYAEHQDIRAQLVHKEEIFHQKKEKRRNAQIAASVGTGETPAATQNLSCMLSRRLLWEQSEIVNVSTVSTKSIFCTSMQHPFMSIACDMLLCFHQHLDYLISLLNVLCN
ncbi:hypothetical protein ACQJBY_043244 [Aegilops geniculata]